MATHIEEIRAMLNTGAITAARDVVEQQGTPGAMKRLTELRHALDAATTTDPALAVIVAAAIMVDRYGTAGSPERVRALRDAIERCTTP